MRFDVNSIAILDLDLSITPYKGLIERSRSRIAILFTSNLMDICPKSMFLLIFHRISMKNHENMIIFWSPYFIQVPWIEDLGETVLQCIYDK
jgi:hypothetical protein